MNHPSALLPLALLPSLVACTELDLDEQDPPEIHDVSLGCEGDTFTAVVTAVDPNYVTNITIDVDDGQTWFPVLEGEGNESLTVWTAEDEGLACDGTWTFTVTATNQWGLQTTEEAGWPQTDPESGGLDPAFGTDAGGQTVVISGTDLGSVDSVSFDGTEATLVSVTEDEVEVLTPTGTADSTVDVVLHAPGAETTLSGAFTYYADQSGLYSGIARPQLYLYDTTWFSIGSAYKNPLDVYGPFVQLDFVLHEPTERENTFNGSRPTADDCDGGSTAYSNFLAGSYLLADSDELGAIALTASGNNYYFVEESVDPSEWTGAAFDVEIVEGADGLPAQVVGDLLRFAEIPDDLSLDYTSSNPVIEGEDVEITWTSSTLDAGTYTVYAVKSNFSSLGTTQCGFSATEGMLSLAWDDLVDGIDTSQMDGFVINLELHEDHETAFVHDDSTFWSRGTLNYWFWLPVEAAEAEE